MRKRRIAFCLVAALCLVLSSGAAMAAEGIEANVVVANFVEPTVDTERARVVDPLANGLFGLVRAAEQVLQVPTLFKPVH